MASADRISITVCGDGGCGKLMFINNRSKRHATPGQILTSYRNGQESRQSHYDWYEANGHTSKPNPTLQNPNSEPSIDNPVTRYDPTIGPPPLSAANNPTTPRLTHPTEDSYSVTRVIDGLTYHLSLTDTAGQEEYRGLWASSNLKSDAFLLVYDITNAYSLDALEHFIQLIDMESEQRIDEGGAPPVKIVAGNKCDLKEGRVISSRQGLEWARKRGCGFMETSAREMVNVEETFACSLNSLFSFARTWEDVELMSVVLGGGCSAGEKGG